MGMVDVAASIEGVRQALHVHDLPQPVRIGSAWCGRTGRGHRHLLERAGEVTASMGSITSLGFVVIGLD